MNLTLSTFLPKIKSLNGSNFINLSSKPIGQSAVEIVASKSLLDWWCFDKDSFIATKLFMPHGMLVFCTCHNMKSDQIKTVKFDVFSLTVRCSPSISLPDVVDSH